MSREGRYISIIKSVGLIKSLKEALRLESEMKETNYLKPDEPNQTKNFIVKELPVFEDFNPFNHKRKYHK